MEPSTHPACPENSDTTASRRLSAHIHHTGALLYDGANSRPALYLSGILVASTSQQFADLFAFRRTGSTTAAMIVLLNTLTHQFIVI